MTSQARIEANRANAEFSTGPITESGKAASARNATRHGLTAAHPVIQPGEQSAFDELRDGLLASTQPFGMIEDVVVSRLIHAVWNMRRCDLLDQAAPPDQPPADSVLRYRTRAEKMFFQCTRELRLLQQERADREAAAATGFPPLLDPAIVPPLASLHKVAKRTQPATPEEAVDSAFRAIDRELIEDIGRSNAAEFAAAPNEPILETASAANAAYTNAASVNTASASAAPASTASASAAAPVATYRRDGPKIGRNDPCGCGSGRKFKHCCSR